MMIIIIIINIFDNKVQTREVPEEAPMRYRQVKQMSYSCPKKNPRPCLLAPLPSTGTRTAAASSAPNENGGRRRARARGKPSKKAEAKRLCHFSSLSEDRTCQPPAFKGENGKCRGTSSPHSPYSPRSPRSPPPKTELCGQALAKRRPSRNKTSLRGGGQAAPGVHPGQHPQAGGGRLGGGANG